MWECIQQLAEMDYPDMFPFREALHHILVTYAYSTVWTDCMEQDELPEYRIETTSLGLLLCCTKCIMHQSDD